MLQATSNIIPSTNRADFNRSDYELLIQQKGRDVLKETSLVCPCKSKGTNQQSNCRNCGGTGLIFINPVQTRMVMQKVNITPNYKAWSEEIVGDTIISCMDTELITINDRITDLNGRGIFNEVLFFRVKGGETFAFTAYDIKEILFIGYFRGVDTNLKQLVKDVDYTYENNIIKIINAEIVPVQDLISITVRYVHAPSYMMIDMKRESMETFELTGTEKLIHLPISGTARRSHYILTAPNLAGDRLLYNGDIL